MSKHNTPPEAYKADWLKSMDKRTSIAQDLQQRHIALCDDLGGIDTLSYQQRALIDRFLWIEYWLQREEANLASGGEFDSGRYTQAVNALAGLVNKLGLQRQKRELSLNQYVKGKQ
ncbi:hypothetical protein NQT74_10660 [Alteromonas stellipolaris]|uniref:hypothetical protein n=1 Tax=Alteromonas stellipolaris TaxID=233316 RepID=UPI00211817F2|nr:hypothetical protein [Alteromonas stellipolaris]MCQ8849041.1 hypothetical protein [Alteromonas stellipolaris]